MTEWPGHWKQKGEAKGVCQVGTFNERPLGNLGATDKRRMKQEIDFSQKSSLKPFLPHCFNYFNFSALNSSSMHIQFKRTRMQI